MSATNRRPSARLRRVGRRGCEGRVRFRIVSLLADHVQKGDAGGYIAQRALLLHFGNIGFFSQAHIVELESLVNDPRAAEDDFQDFFERLSRFEKAFSKGCAFRHVECRVARVLLHLGSWHPKEDSSISTENVEFSFELMSA